MVYVWCCVWISKNSSLNVFINSWLTKHPLTLERDAVGVISLDKILTINAQSSPTGDELSAEEFEALIKDLQAQNQAKKHREQMAAESYDYSVKKGM